MKKHTVTKRIAFALLAVVLVFAGTEGTLRITNYLGDPALSQQLSDIRFAVAGELYGEFDPHRFWKLPNVAPRFSGDHPKIICMADSVTVMYEGKGYPELLAKSLSEAGYDKTVEVFNAGVPEYTTYQAMVYLDRELISEKPDLVTFQFGWNDHWKARSGVQDHLVRFPSEPQLARLSFLQKWRTYRLLRTKLLAMRFSVRVPLDRYQANLENMVRTVKAAGGRSILVGPMYLERSQTWIPLHQKYVEATEKAAADTGAIYIDLQNLFAHSPDLFIEPETDDVHFNWKGAGVIADALAQAVVKNKVLP